MTSVQGNLTSSIMLEPTTPLNAPSGLSQFMDRRNFLRTSVLTGAGVYLATSKNATRRKWGNLFTPAP